jgi:hypothetical protein
VLGEGKLAPKSDPAQSLTLVVTRPFGNETLKILVTKIHVPGLSFLDEVGVYRRGKGDESPLERLINQSGQKTRDDVVITNQPSTWGVITINLTTCKGRNEKGTCLDAPGS